MFLGRYRAFVESCSHKLSDFDSPKCIFTKSIFLSVFSQSVFFLRVDDGENVQNLGDIRKSNPFSLKIFVGLRPRVLGLRESLSRREWISWYLPRVGGARIQCQTDDTLAFWSCFPNPKTLFIPDRFSDNGLESWKVTFLLSLTFALHLGQATTW